MSTSIDFTTVTNSIAALSISGVTVKDADEIPEALGMGVALLVPRPDDFVTDLQITPAEMSKQNLDVSYNLHYTYYHCALGGGLGTFAVYAGMLNNLAAIVKAFAQNETLTGAIDNGAPTIDRTGPVSDPAGNMYHGAELTIHILQFLEV